jgi:hypothetical protein
MKRYIIYYYILIVFLVMGAFASMAQNNYGLTIMGFVAFSFTLLFSIQLIYVIRNKGKSEWPDIIELLGLILLSSILGFRAFYIWFDFVAPLFFGGGLLLIFIYLRKMTLLFKELGNKNRSIGLPVLAFYLSLVLFILFMVAFPFAPVSAQSFGIFGFILMLAFLVISYLNKPTIINGEKTTGFLYILKAKDRSIILASLFILFALFIGLNNLGLLPSLYSDKYPKAYFELINQPDSAAEQGSPNRVNHEEFRETLERFLYNAEKRNSL